MNPSETISTRKLHNGVTNETPEGWIRCSLKTIALRITKGATPTSYGFSYQGEGIRFVKVENLNNGRIDDESIKHFISDEANLNQKRSVLLAGDILFSIAGTIGRTCLVREEDLPANTNQALAIIRGTSDILFPNFLQLQLQSQVSSRQASDQARGGGMNNISLEDVGKIEIWVPPLTEQKRIVAKVEELLARVNATKDRLNKVSIILKRFRQAVLAAACSGRLTTDWREKNPDVEPASEFLKRIQKGRKKPKNPYLNKISREGDIYFDIPDSWSFCFFEDICSNKQHAIKAGPFGSSLTKSCYTPSGYKIYGQEQVIRGDANYGDYYIDETKFSELKSCEVEARDLLISLVGTIGKVLIIPDKFEKGIINPRLVKVSLHSEISPEYIAKYLASPLAINMFIRDSHGGTMEILNLRMLKGLSIPLPPVIEQQEIVRRVEAMFKLADAVEKQVASATLRAEKLTQAILAKAFRGELVPTEAELARRDGRPYETASDLLSRIKFERESKEKSEKVYLGSLKMSRKIRR